MSAIQERKITQIQSTYVQAHQKQEQAIARKRRGLFRRLIAFTILVLVISYGFISTLVSQNAKIEEKLQAKIELEKDLAHLKEEQIILEEEIVKLNDDEYIAKIARRDYFLSEEGEIIFKIADESGSY